MSDKIQIIIGIIIALMLLYIINMVRRDKIDLKYSLSWIVVLVLCLILDIFPGILVFLAELSGISLVSNMVFFVGIIILAVLIYFLTASVSRLSAKVKSLIQEVALLQDQLDKIMKENKNN